MYIYVYIYIYIFPITVFPKLCVKLGFIWQSALCITTLERFLHIWDLVILIYIFVIFGMGMAASQSSLCEWFALCSYRMLQFIAMAHHCVFRYLKLFTCFSANTLTIAVSLHEPSLKTLDWTRCHGRICVRVIIPDGIMCRGIVGLVSGCPSSVSCTELTTFLQCVWWHLGKSILIDRSIFYLEDSRFITYIDDIHLYIFLPIYSNWLHVSCLK